MRAAAEDQGLDRRITVADYHVKELGQAAVVNFGSGRQNPSGIYS